MEFNKVHCGDCLQVISGFKADSIDLTVTSPPYDNLRFYNGYTFDFEHIALELHRVTKNGGTLVWIVADATVNGSETGSSFKQALFFKQIGFNLHDTMIWHKTAKFPHHPNAKRYKQQFDYMFVFTKGAIKTFNPIKDIENNSAGKILTIKTKIKTKNNDKWNGGTKTLEIEKYRMRDNVWIENRSGFDGHPAPFPERLAESHILSWSNSGDLILDPFCGSGTTLKMAKKNDRNYIGIDISNEYCEMSKKRIEELNHGI